MLVIRGDTPERSAEIKIGETVEVRLPETAGTGFQWSIDTADDACCKIAGESRSGPDKAAPGAASEHVWRLQAVQAGESRFGWHYRRPWQHDAPPARTFVLHLRVSA
jgi:inhibitor of cysteine peptidase